MAGGARIVQAPIDGFWRIGRGRDPLAPRPRGPVDFGDSKSGNRWDSATGRFSVLYFSSTLEGCFGETLGRFRPDPGLAFIEDEWRDRLFMELGAIPADWRTRRTAVRASPAPGGPSDFLNIQNARNIQLIKKALGPSLAMFGYTDVDLGLLQGPDRRVTRLVAEWAWTQTTKQEEPRFAGIRYVSRLNPDWELWALFDDIQLVEHQRSAILPTMPDLSKVAKLYGLHVH